MHRPVEFIKQTSRQFGDLAGEFGDGLSAGRAGQCWDNALAESFFAAPKQELLGERRWTVQAVACIAIFERIESRHNTRAAHQPRVTAVPPSAKTYSRLTVTPMCPSKRSMLKNEH
ncbi:hypothetical protein [Kitasatospora sp. NPDC085879]|uniref:hypothetical protein n=1 Tax=Kitasatospora sp. NPDC085879 TaxID=3154769 RepID=UPI00342793FA